MADGYQCGGMHRCEGKCVRLRRVVYGMCVRVFWSGKQRASRRWIMESVRGMILVLNTLRAA